MGDSDYFPKLAERVCEAWTEDLRDLRGAVRELLVGPEDTNADSAAKELRVAKALQVTKELQEITRDQLQETLARTLSPPRDLESQHGLKAIDKISNLAVILARLEPEGWREEVSLHLKRSEHQEALELLTVEDWKAFLKEDVLEARPVSPEWQKPQGMLSDKVHEATLLLRSFAPVVARRAAARLTTRKSLEDIFKAYEFVPNAKNMQTGLASMLQPDGGAPPKFAKNEASMPQPDKEAPSKLAKNDLRKWPRAFAGSLAAELATAVEYPPSVWMLERELKSIEFASAARDKNESEGAARVGDEQAAPHKTTSGAGKKPGDKSNHPRDRAWREGLLGLCFSGGGIRSATFNLGILQGLANRGMLPRFHYLSTVSGGGYISSWLTSWIKRPEMSTSEVAARLSPGIVPDPTDKRLQPIEFLRRFSNYLTPQMGVFSVDTWVIAVVWLRNTLLNLLILLPSLLALLFLPRLLEIWAHRTVTWPYLFLLSEKWQVKILPWVPLHFSQTLVYVQLAILSWVITLIAMNLGNLSKANPQFTAWYVRPWWIRNLIVLPLFPAAWILTLNLWFTAGLLGAVEDVVIFGIGAALALAVLCVANYPGNFKKNWGGNKDNSFLGAAATVAIASAIGGATLLFTLGLDSIFSSWRHDEHGAAAATVWGAPLIVLAIVLLIALLMGLMGRNLPVTGTIFLGRLQTQMAMYAVVWLVWVGIAVYGANISHLIWTRWAKWPAIGAWLWTTTKSILASKDPRSSGPKPGSWNTQLGFYAIVGPYVFIIGLMLALSYVAQKSFQALGCWFSSWTCPLVSEHAWIFAALTGLLLSAILAFVLSICVDVNDFSMNTFYRTRLVRCYLGATNDKRRPMPFIGYDPNDDNIPLASFKNCGNQGDYDGPYPIYNATLNLVHGDELAWQERKGASFVFTPDLCGYETPWNAATDPHAFRNLDFLSYRETSKYAYSPEGVHLGTPMSISGAALSPNMGFYSSPASGFLMTLFNVRLGWWLGNPRHKDHWEDSGPWQGLPYLMKELLGLTDDRAGFVYLSDGGHFENLGIYELVRRRCRYIVACDAEEDDKLNFQGLGNAIRKCREDFGVEIDIAVDRIKPDPATGRSRAHCVVGKVSYPDQPGWGYLVYLKSSLVGDEPADVLEYRAKHPAFPHQSTGDQWFTESQFESYRCLGLHIAKTVFRGATKDALIDLEKRNKLFGELWDRWYPPSEALEKNFTRHAAAYDSLVRELRSDPQLRQLDRVLFPRSGDPPVVILAENEEKVFLFLVSFFQLMENVYLDLDLENTANHPDNAGWMAVFRTWTQSDVFKDVWQRCGWTYGRNFQSFSNRLFGLRDNNHN